MRPVFDTGAKQGGYPSLNQCLEKGHNLIEEIPHILIRFRAEMVGVVSDIRKAFSQIGLNKDDREFLKLLRIDNEGEEMVFNHKRVVFGVNSSPFLLGATIKYHLEEAKKTSELISKLAQSFYVDNCITSVKDQQLSWIYRSIQHKHKHSK